MKPTDVLAHYGTQERIAAALDMTQGSVSAWFRRGSVPYLRQLQIERQTNGALLSDPADLDFELALVSKKASLADTSA